MASQAKRAKVTKRTNSFKPPASKVGTTASTSQDDTDEQGSLTSSIQQEVGVEIHVHTADCSQPTKSCVDVEIGELSSPNQPDVAQIPPKKSKIYSFKKSGINSILGSTMSLL